MVTLNSNNVVEGFVVYLTRDHVYGYDGVNIKELGLYKLWKEKSGMIGNDVLNVGKFWTRKSIVCESYLRTFCSIEWESVTGFVLEPGDGPIAICISIIRSGE